MVPDVAPFSKQKFPLELATKMALGLTQDLVKHGHERFKAILLSNHSHHRPVSRRITSVQASMVGL
jgi:hypothetical protein